VFQALNNLKL